jgi:hypothetical protein
MGKCLRVGAGLDGREGARPALGAMPIEAGRVAPPTHRPDPPLPKKEPYKTVNSSLGYREAMSVETAVQIFAVINLFTIGLSHILQPRAWTEFFLLLREKGRPGVFAVAFLSLWFGSIIAAFHNVWTGLPLVLTLLGWAQVLKALLYFAFPGFGLRRMEMVSVERAHFMAVAGVVAVAIAGLLGYHVVVTWP